MSEIFLPFHGTIIGHFDVSRFSFLAAPPTNYFPSWCTVMFSDSKSTEEVTDKKIKMCAYRIVFCNKHEQLHFVIVCPCLHNNLEGVTFLSNQKPSYEYSWSTVAFCDWFKSPTIFVCCTKNCQQTRACIKTCTAIKNY